MSDNNFQHDVEKIITKECSSTCPRLEGTSGEYAYRIACEFDLEMATPAMIDRIIGKGLMLIAGECLRAITPGEKTYDKNVAGFLDVDEPTVKESKKMVVDLDKYTAWKTSRRKKGKTVIEKTAVDVKKDMEKLGLDLEEYLDRVRAQAEAIQ